ncbi:pEARLI1-like lipid transfer protein 3 [Mercurialis annua]|uniref:pEARLI1-like lipid transfer protein 3 n=1 Tax=Mercurialis annua TaxID=3986 RepID=UPI00215FFBF5|nr:pEARLI1-like lipid transfer protein 3 [Mercurialis annua]
MALRVISYGALLFSVNFLFFTLVNSIYTPDYTRQPTSESKDYISGYNSKPSSAIPESKEYAPDYTSNPSSTIFEQKNYTPNYTSKPSTSKPIDYASDYSQPSSKTQEPISYTPNYTRHPSSTTPEPIKYAPDYTNNPSSATPKPMDYAPDYSSHSSSTPSEPMNYAPDYSSHSYAEPAKCPRDTLKLGVCVNLLKSLLGVTVGTPPHTPCCSLIGDLVDLEAAVCLCTTIKASLLEINLTLPVDLSLLLNYCGKQLPEGFQCA